MTSGLEQHTTLRILGDATPKMGTGHVMRCLALAQAAQDLGFSVIFVGRVQVPWVQERLAAENFAVTFIEEPVPEQESSKYLLQQLGVPSKGNNWVVLDGYHFGLDCQKAVRAAGFKLLVVDDYCHLPEYSCDILLNQNIGAESYVYAGDIGRKLLGMRYALLRREFLAPPLFGKRSGKHKNFLVTLGGGDQSETLRLIAPALRGILNGGATLDILLGDIPKTEAAQAVSDLKCDVALIDPSPYIDSYLKKADFIITSAGSTCYEICALGKPFGFVIVAESQRSARVFFEQHGLATCLADLSGENGLDPADFEQKLRKAIFSSKPCASFEHDKYVWLDSLRRSG